MVSAKRIAENPDIVIVVKKLNHRLKKCLRLTQNNEVKNFNFGDYPSEEKKLFSCQTISSAFKESLCQIIFAKLIPAGTIFDNELRA